MSLERITSGVPGLDKLLSGGYKKNSINLVAGGAGSGKSIFGMQFIIEGVKKGEPGIYITFEENKEKVYEDMKEIGFDLEKLEKTKKFAFLEYKPEQVKKILSEGGGVIESILERVKAKRIVIDSINAFSLLFEDDLAKKEANLMLFEHINKWDCTGILISQDESSDGHTISSAVEFEVDGIIMLYHVKNKGRRSRGIEILKMRGSKVPERTFAMDITSKGIKVNPKRMVPF